MALEINNFSKTSADYAGGSEQYKYRSEDDKATILTAGYFNDISIAFTIKTGSLINIKAFSDEFIALMTNTANVITLNEIQSTAVKKFKYLDFNIPSLNSPAGPNSPTAVTIDGFIRTYEFAFNDILYIGATLPPDYKDGSNMVVNIKLITSNTDTGQMSWELDYRVKTVGEVATGGTITVPFFTIIPPGSDNQLLDTVSLLIDGSTAESEASQFFGIVRYTTNAGYTGTPRVSGIDLKYEADY